VLVLALGACSEAGRPAGGSAPRAAPPPAGSGLGSIEARIFASVNAYRASAGLSAYRYDDRVASLARAHSQAMARGAVSMGHDGMRSRLSAVQGMMSVRNLAENVARKRAGSRDVASAVVADWVGSAVHRRNLRGPHQVTGVGVARAGDGTLYVTELYVQLR